MNTRISDSNRSYSLPGLQGTSKNAQQLINHCTFILFILQTSCTPNYISAKHCWPHANRTAREPRTNWSLCRLAAAESSRGRLRRHLVAGMWTISPAPAKIAPNYPPAGRGGGLAFLYFLCFFLVFRSSQGCLAGANIFCRNFPSCSWLPGLDWVPGATPGGD